METEGLPKEKASLLDELLQDNEPDMSPLLACFKDAEEMEDAMRNISIQVINAWGANDRLIRIECPIGVGDLIRYKLSKAEMGNLQPIYNDLKKDIRFQEYDPDVTGGTRTIRMFTFKQDMMVNEIISMYGWANDPKVNLYGKLKEAGYDIRPSMEELRLMYLINIVLDMREKGQTIVTPSFVPRNLKK